MKFSAAKVNADYRAVMPAPSVWHRGRVTALMAVVCLLEGAFLLSKINYLAI
jgi:hypothetical protein